MARLPSWNGRSTAASGCRRCGPRAASSTSTKPTAGSGSRVRTLLSFDTAPSVTSCSLVRDGDVLGERVTTAKAVLEAADELVRDAGLEPRDVDALVVGTGPGSFTSIRIGLATARGLGL